MSPELFFSFERTDFKLKVEDLGVGSFVGSLMGESGDVNTDQLLSQGNEMTGHHSNLIVFFW